MKLHAFAFLAMSLLPVSAVAQAPTGIPRELARSRAARVSGLRYELNYRLIPHADTTSATEHLTFTLSDAAAPLLLDFRQGEITALSINTVSFQPERTNGHLVLPAAGLKQGANTVDIAFSAPVAAAEKAITRFEDKDDGSEYLYTLFVPMDAEMAFPCFDQPDLKARFQLTVVAPSNWTVISNTAPLAKSPLNAQNPQLNKVLQTTIPGTQSTTFAETEPISTYLFAFAAGPFQRINPDPALPGIYVRKSRAKQAATEAPIVQRTAAEGIRYLSNYFAQPFPLPKYDMVLLPGFAYGGMEHAGATFLREESVLFRTAPTATNLFARDTLVLHELTHQWFGDFTTMRWFDDLWLKEGFAQYMAYQALAALHPERDVWKRFYQSIKPAAYAIDETLGTTPIYQDIPNLKDAKSAYGAIVYSKAPGVIKQLHYVIGDAAFQHGLQNYLAQHKYSNAEWSDLVHALEQSSGRDLQSWSAMWIRHRGMPVVTTTWSCSKDQLATLALTQHPALSDDPASLWPIATQILVGLPDGSSVTINAQLTGADSHVPLASPQPCPAYILANHNDHAYGLFLLDPRSLAYITHHPETLSTTYKDQSSPPERSGVDKSEVPVTDNLNRTLLYGALWDSVREAELAPADYVRLTLTNLPHETDESLAASLLGRTQVALHRYVTAAQRTELAPQLQQLAAQQMLTSPSQDLRINYFRALPGVSESESARALLKSILNEQTKIPGVTLRPQDRWNLVTTLIAYNDAEAEKYLAAEKQRDPSGDGQKFAWAAEAAHPSATSKQHYFNDFLHNPQRPEDWIESSLGTFNYWNQTILTERFLKPALDALPQIKGTRKIFFLVGWLDAFLLNQQSPSAQRSVHAYLDTPGLDPDLRLKILQALDELDRTVRIRSKFAQ